MGLMKIRPVTAVRPGLKYLDPNFSRPVFYLVRLLAGAYLRFVLRIRKVRVPDPAVLTDCLRRHREGRLRLIVAFRHPHPDDGPVLFHLFSALLPRFARREGRPFSGPSHVRFVYSRDVPVWSGRAAEVLFPLMGAVPVLHGKYDSRGLSRLREFAASGPFPVAVAPESQVTYHNGLVGPLDPGAAWIALRCAEDLEKAGKDTEVFILPVATRYRWDEDWKGLELFLDRIDPLLGNFGDGGFGPPAAAAQASAASNASNPGSAAAEGPGPAYIRIQGLLDRLLTVMESHYARFHGRRELDVPAGSTGERLEKIVNAALETAEKGLGIRPAPGGPVQRVFAVRMAGLDRMFRDDLLDPARLPPLARSLADRAAGEAWTLLRHMELADVLEYIRADYLLPDSPFGRFAETAENLYDIINRLRGGNIGGRRKGFARDAELLAGRPIAVPRAGGGGTTRSGGGRRTLAAELTEEIGREFWRMAGDGG
jgi:1-acyl-sn-glycerol-3-phosphate acyltransferase